MVDVSGRFVDVVGTKAFVVADPARRAQTNTVAVDDKDRIGMLIYCFVECEWKKVGRRRLNTLWLFGKLFYDHYKVRIFRRNSSCELEQ